MSDLVHLRLDEKVRNRVDEIVEYGYFSNRSEFIRDAIRRLVIEFDKLHALLELENQKNSLKGEHVTEEDKAKALKELIKQKGWEIKL